jgi:hypothetical protein
VAAETEHARDGASFLPRPGWLGASARIYGGGATPGAGPRRAGALFLAAELAAKGHHEATPMHQPPGSRVRPTQSRRGQGQGGLAKLACCSGAARGRRLLLYLRRLRLRRAAAVSRPVTVLRSGNVAAGVCVGDRNATLWPVQRLACGEACTAASGEEMERQRCHAVRSALLPGYTTRRQAGPRTSRADCGGELRVQEREWGARAEHPLGPDQTTHTGTNAMRHANRPAGCCKLCRIASMHAELSRLAARRSPVEARLARRSIRAAASEGGQSP